MASLVLGLQTIALWAGEVEREASVRRGWRRWKQHRDWLAKHFGGAWS